MKEHPQVNVLQSIIVQGLWRVFLQESDVQGAIKYILDFQADPTDALLTSYPKTGQ